MKDVLAAGCVEKDAPAAAAVPTPEVDFGTQPQGSESASEQGAEVQVERILAKRIREGEVEYQVRWADQGAATWEPAGSGARSSGSHR